MSLKNTTRRMLQNKVSRKSPARLQIAHITRYNRSHPAGRAMERSLKIGRI